MTNDDYGKVYMIKKLDAFKYHIQKYYLLNGRANGSLHEENGFWFKVTDEFHKKIMSI